MEINIWRNERCRLELKIGEYISSGTVVLLTVSWDVFLCNEVRRNHHCWLSASHTHKSLSWESHLMWRQWKHMADAQTAVLYSHSNGEYCTLMAWLVKCKIVCMLDHFVCLFMWFIFYWCEHAGEKLCVQRLSVYLFAFLMVCLSVSLCLGCGPALQGCGIIQVSSMHQDYLPLTGEGIGVTVHCTAQGRQTLLACSAPSSVITVHKYTDELQIMYIYAFCIHTYAFQHIGWVAKLILLMTPKKWTFRVWWYVGTFPKKGIFVLELWWATSLCALSYFEYFLLH